MNKQISASFRKEFMAFVRTKTFLILLLIFVGLAIFTPLMIRGMITMVDAMSDIYDEFGIDMSGLTGALGESAATGVANSINSFLQVGLIVYMLLLCRFAGGEQQKRSIIIPQSSGLDSKSYLLPKFIIYPVAAMFLSIIGVLVASMISSRLFVENDLNFTGIFTAGFLLGVNMMMYVCFHLCMGTATGKAGMSAGICIGVMIIVPQFFGLISMNIEGDLVAYNPFSLGTMAMNSLYAMPDFAEAATTVVITFGIMMLVYFLALFAQNAKRIDNKGNEMVI